MIKLFLDFETFWGVGYSLRQQKINYTDYIYDDRFEVLGVSVFLEGVHDYPKFMRDQEFRKFINTLDWSSIHLICHNTLFDGYILHCIYRKEAGRYSCTLAMSEALHQGAINNDLNSVSDFLGYGGKTDTVDWFKDKMTWEFTDADWKRIAHYGNGDVTNCRAIYAHMAPQLPEAEHLIMDRTLSMFCDPILEIDVGLAKEALEEAIEARRVIIETAGVPEQEIRGDISFRKLLEDRGIEVGLKWSEKQEKLVPAFAKTDPGFIELLEHPSSDIRSLAAARVAVSSTQPITRAQRFIDMAGHGDGLFAVCLHYYRAHTGRESGGNKMNPQNNKKGSKLRKSIIAPKGFVLGVADSSQIECRMSAYISQQNDLLDLFRNKEDPYCAMGPDIYQREITKDDVEERFVCKQSRLGLQFYMGWRTFQRQVKAQSRLYLKEEILLSDSFSNQVVDTYRAKNPYIVNFWKVAENFLHRLASGDPANDTIWMDGLLRLDCANKRVYFPSGMYCYYPGLSYEFGDFTYVQAGKKCYYNKTIFSGAAVENWVQHLARDAVFGQLIEIDKRYRITMRSHDEGVPLIPEAEAEEGIEWCLEQMRVPPQWAPDLPLDAEGGYDYCYSK